MSMLGLFADNPGISTGVVPQLLHVRRCLGYLGGTTDEADTDPEGPEAASIDPSSSGVAVITGASGGIGAATARLLARSGWRVILGARRIDLLSEVASDSGSADHYPLDVTDPTSIASFVANVKRADVLINNAGLALGLDPIGDIDEADVQTMWETNVLGLIRVTKAFLPLLERSGRGHIVNLGSTAGFETYPGGGGYTASKHAVKALTRTLRLELLDAGIKVTEVAPGLVETDFSLVRFGHDAARAAKPYAGMDPLSADDVAAAILWAVTRPPHVNIDEIVMRPQAQANSTTVNRKS